MVLLRCPFLPEMIPVKLESRQQRWCDLTKDTDNVHQKEGIKPTCRVIRTLFQNTFTIDYSKDLHMERLVGYVYDDSDQSTQYYTIYNDYKTVSITPLDHLLPESIQTCITQCFTVGFCFMKAVADIFLCPLDLESNVLQTQTYLIKYPHCCGFESL